MKAKDLIRIWRSNADCSEDWANKWLTDDNKEGHPNPVMAAECQSRCDVLRECADALYKSTHHD